MNRSPVDPCVLFKRQGTDIEGLVLLKVDDSLGFVAKDFLDEEEAASKTFKSQT